MRDDKLFACDARKCLDRLDLGVDNEKIVLPQEGALVFWGSRVNVGRWGKNSFLLAHNTNRWHFIHCFQCKVQLTLQCSHCAQSWEWTVGAQYRALKEGERILRGAQSSRRFCAHFPPILTFPDPTLPRAPSYTIQFPQSTLFEPNIEGTIVFVGPCWSQSYRMLFCLVPPKKFGVKMINLGIGLVTQGSSTGVT